ncbi:MAG: tetratricopeptide repeat protein, partial [Polyangiales bacterium]
MRRARSLPLFASALALAMALPACAGRSSGDKELSGLREELAKVQRDHDMLERRVNALESQDDEPHALDGESVVINAEPQPLKIVKLEPKGAEPKESKPLKPLPTYDDDGDYDTPRPMLKIGPGGVEESYPDEVANKKTKKKPAIDPKAAPEYDAAFALVKAKKWTKALDAFAGFVVRYPDHPYVANAMYWRGECYSSLAQYGAAVDQLEGLLVSYPASAKVPDALLALGLAQRKLGSFEKS